MLKAGSASHSGLYLYGPRACRQVLALGAQAIIGTAETDCVHRGTSGAIRILSETELRRVWLTSACLAAILGRTRPEVRMADIHIETLRKLRDVLVEQRRSAANEAARLISSDAQAALEKIAAVLDFHSQIEGLDRVILDEEDIANNTMQVGEMFGSD
jgi:hypothetical protein